MYIHAGILITWNVPHTFGTTTGGLKMVVNTSKGFGIAVDDKRFGIQRF
jgi:hypothetical protein